MPSTSETISDLMSQQRIGLDEAAELLRFREDGRTLSRSTLIGFIREGRRGCRLRAYCVGDRWVTSREAVIAFLAELTDKNLAEKNARNPKGLGLGKTGASRHLATNRA